MAKVSRTGGVSLSREKVKVIGFQVRSFFGRTEQ